MNISDPVADTIGLVDFKFYSTNEIRAISVKQIQNETTFDELTTPLPGGLYDGALGSWGDATCDTCHLRQSQCPGHPGHIELPVPVYHPVFMDHVLLLLRSQCQYCHGFKMPRRQVHAYICKLRLLQYGLLKEAHLVDNCGEDVPGLTSLPDWQSEAEEEGNLSIDAVIKARDGFVRKALHGQKPRRADIQHAKHEGSTQFRRALVKEFLTNTAKSKQCASCRGISHGYRKDRFVKIFEKPLTAKDGATMARRNMKATDAMARPRKRNLQTGGRYPRDEGVADLDVDSSASENGNVAGERDVVQSMAEEVGRADKDDEEESESVQRYISAMEVHARLTQLFQREQEVLVLVYNARPQKKGAVQVTADRFFLRALLVPPNRYRPEARMGAERVREPPQHTLYKNILRSCGRMNQIYRELVGASAAAELEQGVPKRNVAHLHQAWTELQESVNCLIDRTKSSSQGMAAQRAVDGIKQQLEKKDGLFRMNMMGKRVNYAARSVIAPDPNIETSEIGIPPVFAMKLSYPEPVTMHNVRELMRAVENGPDKYPGALSIENEAGQVLNLKWKSAQDRKALAHQLLTPSTGLGMAGRNKKVYRHLAHGDVVIMNRQPTLHKPSMMGHRVRVLPGQRTLRMHYANCNTYNADFDGDEMNMHFPQNEFARAEALDLADTDHQYLSGTQGSPLRGLIQDHLSISVALCSKDMFFSRADYHQLVYSALRPEHGHTQQARIQVLAPAIVKPMPLWTGKQVITTILRNVTPALGGGLWMRADCKIKGSSWGTSGAEEEFVIFQDGIFVTGILDKSQLGPTPGGLIHSIHEIYGPKVAARLLSSLGRLLTRTLGMQAFTCGMDDLTLTPEGERFRQQELAASQRVGFEVAREYVGLASEDADSTGAELSARLEEVMRDDSKQHNLDQLMNRRSAELSTAVTKACLPRRLDKPFPMNNMQAMTMSGAKGSQVNANQISVNLGQQVLEGRRVPLMVSGKSLPCFRPQETNIRAGGYIVNRFLTGIRLPEYYFHHMAGREGLIDTAVKTSRSGYLQRCIIKGMEGLSVAYDTTVRDADGTLVQFLYGEDGLDVTKQQFLFDFDFVLQNFESQSTTLLGEGNILAMAEKKAAILKHMKSAIKHANSRSRKAKDPVSSLYNPCRDLFATSERFFAAMTGYLSDNEKGGKRAQVALGVKPPSPPGEKLAMRLMATKYMRSLVEPGEAVGIVAGQSIGEPSTQMTLNTFHLAGHSAKNVTLGIPRLREILMTAARHPSTPSMTLVVSDDLSPEQGLSFAKSISKLPLSHVLDAAKVTESVGSTRTTELARTYKMQLAFFPGAELRKTYGIEPTNVISTVESRFIPQLLSLIKKETRRREVATPAVGVRAGAVETASSRARTATDLGKDADAGDHDDDEDDDNDDDDYMDDGDATNDKQRANRSAAVSYGPNDEEDNMVQQQMEREASPPMGDGFEDEGYGGRSPSPPVMGASTGSGSGSGSGMDINDSGGDGSDTDEEDDRSRRIREKYAHVTHFRCSGLSDETKSFAVEFTIEFPVDMAKLLMINVVKEAVRKSVIQQVTGLGECTFVPDENIGVGEKAAVVHTAGVNLRAMWQYPQYIDPNRIITNDIAAVLDEYGVEACRNNIIRELRDVFKSHNITVDYRHLNLVADYMTRNGSFTPFNRTGLQGNISPFTKMSFETTLSFLKDALVDGDWDNLATPSGRLVTGKLGRIGTGSFELLARTPTARPLDV